MKTLTIFLTVLCTHIYGQDYNFEIIYNGTNETNATAKKHKIKSELCYEYKNESSKKSEFQYKKQFTKEGYLYKSRWLDKEKNKFVDTQYDYDSIGRITKINSEISSLVYDLELTQVVYSNDGKLSKLLHYYGPKDYIVFDTLSFTYNAANKLAYKILHFKQESQWLTDTTYYHYDSLGGLEYMRRQKEQKATTGVPIILPLAGIVGGLVLWYVIPLKTIVDDDYFINTENCKIKIDFGEKNYIEIKRDSLCNMLEWSKVKKAKGEWAIYEEGTQSFDANNLRLEEKIFRCKNIILSNCNNQPQFQHHIKYHYNNKGLVDTTMWIKENGKIKHILRNTYEYF